MITFCVVIRKNRSQSLVGEIGADDQKEVVMREEKRGLTRRYKNDRLGR